MTSLVMIVGQAAAIDVVVLALCVGVAATMLRRLNAQDMALLLVWVVLDDLVALTPIVLHWNPGRWNWLGQAASLLLALATVRWRFSSAEVGLRWPPGRTAWVWTAAGVFGALLISAIPALTGDGSHPDLETFVYQATVPGLVEELVFRGVVLAFLVRSLSRRPDDKIAVTLAALITAVWFTAGHVIHLDAGVFHLAWARIWDVLPMALLYVGVRLASRSLLGGVLAHNGANTLVEAISAVRF